MIIKFCADVAICRNRQVIEQGDGAFGNVFHVLTDCLSAEAFAKEGRAALAITDFFES
jgi:hypothetical protein